MAMKLYKEHHVFCSKLVFKFFRGVFHDIVIEVFVIDSKL